MSEIYPSTYQLKRYAWVSCLLCKLPALPILPIATLKPLSVYCRCTRFSGDLELYGRFVSKLACSDLHHAAAINPQYSSLLTPCPLFRGSTKETRGTAYVVYEDIYDAKTAVEHLSGFNVANRYLIVLYYNHNKHSKKVSLSSHELPSCGSSAAYGCI